MFVVAIVFALWPFPPATPAIGIGFFLFGLAVTISAIFKRQRRAYLQDKITHSVFVCNVLAETIGILLAITLAGLLGRIIVQMATAQIANGLVKAIASIVVALLVGLSMGVVVKQTWGRLTKSFR